MKVDKIKVAAIIEADRSKVWTYYTDTAHIVNWNFADPSWHCPRAENDLVVGGRYLSRMEAKDGSMGFDFEAVYTEIVVEQHFVYEFSGRQVKVEFFGSDNATEVRVSFDPETENPIEMQKNGWQAILDNFKQYAESITSS